MIEEDEEQGGIELMKKELGRLLFIGLDLIIFGLEESDVGLACWAAHGS